MPVGGFLSFSLGAAVSLTTSWVLVSRLERLGERVGLSEGLLGLVVALAADLPEITSAVTALANHQRAVGATVVIGSNVFNLAALLGLSAVVAGHIRLQPRAVALDGSVALGVGALTFAVVSGAAPPAVGLGVLLVVLAPYAALLGAGPRRIARLRLPARWTDWATEAVAEEELELALSLRPARGRARDLWVAICSLGVVVAASAVMERGATSFADHYAIEGVVVGGLILAVATSLPNAVAAVYLARRGRGAAVLSEAFNSNNLNVLFGLMVPATILGVASSPGPTSWAGAWYLGMTVLAAGVARAGRGLGWGAGLLIVAGYLGFVGWLLAG
jgi:cation:H+ antiporter